MSVNVTVQYCSHVTVQYFWLSNRRQNIETSTADTVPHSIMVNITWRRFDQSANQPIDGHTTFLNVVWCHTTRKVVLGGVITPLPHRRPSAFLVLTPHYILKCSLVWLWCRSVVPGLWTKVGTCRRHHNSRAVPRCQQDPNAGTSHVVISSAKVISRFQMRFRSLPVLGAARRRLRLTGKVWLPISVL